MSRTQLLAKKAKLESQIAKNKADLIKLSEDLESVLKELESSLLIKKPNSVEDLVKLGYFDASTVLKSNSTLKEIQDVAKKYSKIIWPLNFDLSIEDKPFIPTGKIDYIGGRFVKSVNLLEKYQVINLGETVGGTWQFIKVTGDRDSYKGNTPGEHGMCIITDGAQGLTLNQPECTKGRGDGIYVDDAKDGRKTKDLKIVKAKCYNNRRNNISIISVDGLDIDAASLEQANGTNPQNGLDIEPNLPTEVLKRVYIKGTTTRKNKQQGWQAQFKGFGEGFVEVDITIDDLYSREDDCGMKIAGAGKNISGHITLNNPFFSKYKRIPLEIYNFVAGNKLKIVMNNPRLQDTKGTIITNQEEIRRLLMKGVQKNVDIQINFK